MKALITNVTFTKEFETKFGVLYGFKIEYNGKTGFYSSKKREQTKFIKGQESEFEEEIKQGKNGSYTKIKPMQPQGGFSNFGRAVKKEQSKYSGFAMSYAKDLVCAGAIKYEQMFSEAQCMMDWMVEQDKQLSK